MERKLIAAAVSSALALPMAAQAVEVNLSGHISRIAQHVSGNEKPSDTSSWNFKDAGVSGTRFRMTGTEELDGGLTAGINLEYAGGSEGGDNPSLRHANLTLGGAFGSLAFGQTGPATNGTNDDLSASGLAVDMACSDAVKHSISGLSVCTDFTAGRRGVVRYNTPGTLPVGFGASIADNLWDAQVSTSGSVGDGSYAFRASYAANDPEQNPVDSKTVSLAAAVKFGGTSISTLWGQIDPDGDNNDSTGYGVKLGYDFNDDTGLGVLYRSGESDLAPDLNPSVWGFGAQRNLSDSVSMFTGYYVSDSDIQDDEKIKTFNMGMRVKFN